MFDLPLIRLQYEILNIPQDILEQMVSLPSGGLDKDIADQQWTQYWPDPDMIVEATDGEDGVEATLVLQSDRFIDRTKRRLAVFKVAKEMLLAQRYAALELGIVQHATDLLTAQTLAPGEIKQLSALYKDMSSNSLSADKTALSFGQDEGGLPTVIVRDLSGQGQST